MTHLDAVLNANAPKLERSQSNSEKYVSSKAAKRMGFIVNRGVKNSIGSFGAGVSSNTTSTEAHIEEQQFNNFVNANYIINSNISINEKAAGRFDSPLANSRKYSHLHSHTEANINRGELFMGLKLPSKSKAELFTTLQSLSNKAETSTSLQPSSSKVLSTAGSSAPITRKSSHTNLKPVTSTSDISHRLPGTSYYQDIPINTSKHNYHVRAMSTDNIRYIHKTKPSLLSSKSSMYLNLPDALSTIEEDDKLKHDNHQLDKTSAYFKRMSILPEMPRNQKDKTQILKFSRKLLFAFSELYQALKRFNLINDNQTRIRDKIIVTLLISKKQINKLVEVLEHSEGFENNLETDVTIQILHHLSANVSIFKQLLTLMLENIHEVTKKSDVCFLRILILSVYGCYNEICNAWNIMAPSGPTHPKEHSSPINTASLLLNMSQHQATLDDQKLYESTKPGIDISHKLANSILAVLATNNRNIVIQTKPGESKSLVKETEAVCKIILAVSLEMNKTLQFQHTDVEKWIFTKNTFFEDMNSLVQKNIELLGLLKDLIGHVPEVLALRADITALSKFSKTLLAIVQPRKNPQVA